MDQLIARYLYWLLAFSAIVIANISPDKHRRLSRALRATAYLSIWVPLGLGLFTVDMLQVFFILLCSISCLAISLYSEGYLRIMFGRIAPLQFITDSALVLLLIFFTAGSLIELVVLWISIELVGFILILLEKGVRNWGTATKYLIICATAGDISLFTWLAIASLKLGLEKGLLSSFSNLQGLTADPFMTFLLTIGFTAKLAQVPLHIWLPDTYTESPAVSTAIFSGLMSKMAVYGLLRLYYTVGVDATVFTYTLLVQGIITTVYGFLMAAAQTDVRRMLAYSSMGHYGVITMFIGLIPIIGWAATTAVLIYSLYHGVVKTLTFLNTGTIEVLANTRDIYKLGYLAKVASEVYGGVLVGFLALIGVPPTIGFIAKFLTVAIALLMLVSGLPQSLPLLVGVVFASIFSIVYSVKYLGVYTGSFVREPFRPVISLEDTQLFAERLLAVSLIVLPLIPLLAARVMFYPLIALVYVLSLVVLAASFILYGRAGIREADVWVGGVET